jgi:tyrosine-protein phosphatase SIW14
MSRSAWLNLALLIAFLVAAPYGYARYRKANFRNFHVVEDGILCRSGQLSKAGLERAVHDYGIRTVITLRESKSPGDPQPDQDEEDFCLKEEIWYFRLPHRASTGSKTPWLKTNGYAAVDPNVAKFLRIMDDAKYHPVLVHCTAGTHRTGAYVAIYRMEYERWSNADAIAELIARGYDDIVEQNDILGYLETYEPRWKKAEQAAAAAR